MIPAFSVVIPTCQQPALLLKCLDALGRQQLPRSQFELIVVDDANSKETETAVNLFARQIARTGEPLEVRYLAQPHRLGMAAARNRGWKAARGGIIAFTDDDCLPEPGWLSAALACFERNAQVLSGNMQVFLPEKPTPLDRTATLLRKADFVTANCFCRKAVLEQVGGFCEAFKTAWRDDSDLHFRFLGEGVLICKCPEAVVHLHIRSGPWYGLLNDERNNCYDALLYKRHPMLFRERIPTHRKRVWQYYVLVLIVLLVAGSLLTGQFALALIGLGVWGVMTSDLLMRYLPSGPISWERSKHALAVSIAIPFAAVYWRLYGAVRHGVIRF